MELNEEIRRFIARHYVLYGGKEYVSAIGERLVPLSLVNNIVQTMGDKQPKVSATTQRLIDLLVERDAIGRAKYGTTLDRTDLTRDEWLQHMVEELLDGAGYALAAQRSNATNNP